MVLVRSIVAVSSISATIVSASTNSSEPSRAQERKAQPMSTDTVNQKVPTGTWTVDPVHSSISFAVTHNNVATFRSGFGSYEATLTGGDQPKLEGSVDVQSIGIHEAQLKGHLMTPDFFDVERFPKLTFSSTRLDVADDGTVSLAGELSIKGNSREVEATGRF